MFLYLDINFFDTALKCHNGGTTSSLGLRLHSLVLATEALIPVALDGRTKRPGGGDFPYVQRKIARLPFSTLGS